VNRREGGALTGDVSLLGCPAACLPRPLPLSVSVTDGCELCVNLCFSQLSEARLLLRHHPHLEVRWLQVTAHTVCRAMIAVSIAFAMVIPAAGFPSLSPSPSVPFTRFSRKLFASCSLLPAAHALKPR